MKNSKRISRLVEKVDSIEEALEFFTNGNSHYFKTIQEIKSLISELYLDQKEHDIRLIKKWSERYERLKR